MYATYDLDCFWSAISDNIEMTFPTNTPAFNSFTVSDLNSGGSFEFSLSIPRNSFAQGSLITFRLTAHAHNDPNKFKAYGEIDVLINSPPCGGSVVASPLSGYSLKTIFSIKTMNWNADTYPISYIFSYQLAESLPALVIQSLSTMNQASSDLPAGLDAQNYLVHLK